MIPPGKVLHAHTDISENTYYSERVNYNPPNFEARDIRE
jgi:hypothetical protein